MMTTTNFARWIAALLVVSAAIFAFAVLMEQRDESGGHQEVMADAGETSVESGDEEQEHKEAGEGHTEGAEAGEGHTEGAEPGEGHNERAEAGEELLGMNFESPWLVWGFVVVSALLAVAVLQLWKPAFALTVLVSGVAALLDIWEVVTQFDTAMPIAILALLVAVAHAAAAVLAVVALSTFQRPISD
jgi:hypothetical protein